MSESIVEPVETTVCDIEGCRNVAVGYWEYKGKILIMCKKHGKEFSELEMEDKTLVLETEGYSKVIA